MQRIWQTKKRSPMRAGGLQKELTLLGACCVRCAQAGAHLQLKAGRGGKRSTKLSAAGSVTGRPAAGLASRQALLA
jgi:hypothetical protein